MLTVSAQINAPISQVWKLWTTPSDIMQWNFAHESWHCPSATNDLTIGGEFHYQMAAKDGSFAFDFWGTYDAIENEKSIEITLGDNRKMKVDFVTTNNGTLVTEHFDPEKVNPIEMQEQGWQAILNQFKHYAESNS
jgi:uncharacterized protein YndB with AHSA1/START domain